MIFVLTLFWSALSSYFEASSICIENNLPMKIKKISVTREKKATYLGLLPSLSSSLIYSPPSNMHFCMFY